MNTTIKISILIKICIPLICFVIIKYMAFNTPSWSIGGYKLPELGITERLGGKTGSIGGTGTAGNGYGSLYSANKLQPAVDTANYYSSPTKNTATTQSYNKAVNSNISNAAKVKVGSSSGSKPDTGSAAASKAKGEAYIPGLSDLKQTQGFLDFLASNPDATGADYLNFMNNMGGEIDKLYGESENLLNKQEQALRGSEQELYNIAQSPYNEAMPELQAATEQGRAQYKAGMEDTSLQGRTLLSEAQRLADELSQRNRQAFGGAELSSAAQAAGELLGRNTAQQLGSIRQNTAQTVQKLQQGLIDFENQSKAKVQQLELQKGKALSEAKLKFQDTLSQIDSQRSALAQNKAAAKLDALREFRQQVADINAQERAFRQQIELQREQARLDASRSINELSQLSGGIPSSLNDLFGLMNQQAQQGNQNTLSYNTVSQPQNLSGFIGNLFGRRENNLG